jgi:hypothetical protein
MEKIINGKIYLLDRKAIYLVEKDCQDEGSNIISSTISKFEREMVRQGVKEILFGNRILPINEELIDFLKQYGVIKLK